MKNYLLPIFALLIVGCGNQRPRQTYDEMLNDIVQNFNTGTTGGDSVLNAFVRKTQADSVARQYSNPAIKEEMMFNLISDYLVAGQVDNAQHLYDNMLEYAESEYGKVCQMKATVYFEKAHLYEQTGDLDNAIKMMQKSAEVFEQLPMDDNNRYEDAKEFIKWWVEDLKYNLKTKSINTFYCFYKQPICGYKVKGVITRDTISNGERGGAYYLQIPYDDYDIDLIFTSENTNKSFTIYGGKLSRLHYDPSHDKDSVYVDYEEPRVAAPNIYISNHELFCFMDVDFDGQAEILTDVIPNISQRGVGVFTAIYKIINDKPVNIISRLPQPFQGIDQHYFGINTQRKEIFNILSGGGGYAEVDIYKFNFRTQKYIFSRIIDCDWHGAGIAVSIISPTRDTLKRFNLTYDEESKIWEY